jgi:hypothetical protein
MAVKKSKRELWEEIRDWILCVPVEKENGW